MTKLDGRGILAWTGTMVPGMGAERVPAFGQLPRFDWFKIVPQMPMLA